MAGVMVEYTLGQSSPEVQYMDASTIVTICGNALRFQQLDGRDAETRFLWGASRGIAFFAISARRAVVAYAEKGLNPSVYIHDSQSLELLMRLTDIAELDITMLAFFPDGSRLLTASGVPDYAMTIHDVSTGQEQARVKLEAPLSDVSFNPRNEMQISTLSDAVLTLWTLEKSYETYYLTSKPLHADTLPVTAHAWTPNGGLFAGTSSGQVLLLDPQTGRIRGPQFLAQLDHYSGESNVSTADPGARKPVASATEKGNKIPLGPALPSVNLLSGKLAGIGAKSTKQGGKTMKLVGNEKKGLPDVLPGDNEPVFLTDGPVKLLTVAQHHLVFGGSKLERRDLRRLQGSSNSLASFRKQSGLVLDLVTESAAENVSSGSEVAEESEGKIIELGGAMPVSLAKSPGQSQLLVLTSDGSLRTVDLTPSDDKDFSDGTSSHNADSTSQRLSENFQRSTNVKEHVSTQIHSNFHLGGLNGLAILTPLKLLVTAGAADMSLRFWGMERGNYISRHSFSSRITCLQACDSKSLLAVGSDSGVVRILQVSDGQGTCVTLFRKRLHVAAIHRLRFSPSGDLLASCSMDGRVFVSKSDTGSFFTPLGIANFKDEVLDFRWADSILYLSLSSSEIVRLEMPEKVGDTLLSDAAFKRSSFNVEEPLLSFEILSKDKGAAEPLLTGLTADKCVRHYTLSEGTTGWTGPGGKAKAPVFERTAHAKPGQAIALSFDGKLTVTGASDGALQLRPTLKDVSAQDAGELQLHAASAGGICHVAVSAGRVFTAGADNVVFVCDAVDAGIVRSDGQKHSRKARPTLNPGELVDVDMPDSPTEPDLVTETSTEGGKAAELTEEVTDSDCGNEETRAKIRELKERFRQCVERNEKAPESEQLSRSDFVVDMDVQEALSADGRARVGIARAQIAAQIARAQLLHARLKAEFWDSMDTHSETLCPLVTGPDVQNFPLTGEGLEEVSAREVADRRRAELERTGMPEAAGRESPLDATTTGVLSETVRSEAATDATADAPRKQAASEATAADSSTQELLYGAFELTTLERKTEQIQLLKLVGREKRAAFNARFAAARAKKQAAMDKVAEMNARLADIQKELGVKDALTSYSLHDREKSDFLLTVKDSEVKAEWYISPEELQQIEDERKAEEERQRSKRGDDPQERALRDMMGGKLQSKADEEAQAELKRPEWMSGDRGKMNDEQVKQVKEFEAKEKAFKEEQEKKRKALELEHKRLLEDASKPAAAFDAELQALRKHRSDVLAECLEAELQVARLAASIVAEEETDERLEVGLSAEVERLKATCRARGSAAADFKREVEAKKEEYESVLAEDKAMERGFKRDFADCGEAAEALFRFFKRRAKKGLSPRQGVSPESSGKLARKSRMSATSVSSFKQLRVPLPSIGSPPDAQKRSTTVDSDQLDYSEKPETVSDLQWERLLDARARKLAQEEEVRTLGAQLAEMQRHMTRLLEEDDVSRRQLEEAMAALSSFRVKREERRRDLDVPFHLKQGLVEADLDPFRGDLEDASLLHRSVVEDVNADVRKHGGQKIDILTAIKDFKKGIYEAQWQVQKLEMDEEDLVEQIKQFQLLRVTKQLQTVIKNGEDISTANEVAALENRLGHDQKLHEKKLQERASLLRKLEKQAADISAQTTEVKKRLAVLQEQHEAHARVRDIQVSSQASKRNATERMKSLVTQRQLRDIANAQAEEISGLQKELTTLRMRTFPLFEKTPNGSSI